MHTPDDGSRAEPLAAVLGLAFVITVLQVIPLPASLAQITAPDALRHMQATSALVGLPPPGAVPFTLDPGRTQERVLYAAAVWATFCAACLLAKHRGTILAAVAWSGILIAASHLGHVVFQATRVYGLYAPRYTLAVGPLLNPNNLAGLLAMTSIVCLGLAAQHARWRGLWIGGAVFTAATCIYANSRGGTAALFGGALLFAALLWWNAVARTSRHAGERSRSDRRVGTLVAISLAAVAVLGTSYAVASLAAQQPLDANYQDVSKLDLLREAAHFLFHNSRTFSGIGRGAFAAAFSAARFGTGQAIYPESFPLQYAIEFGLPLAILFIGATSLRVFAALITSRSPAQLGGLCACVAIGVQNLLDYGLELSGIAVPAAACLAASLPDLSKGLPWARIKPLALASAAGGIAMAALLGSAAVQSDSRATQRELENELRTKPQDEFWPPLKSAMVAHPADPGLAALGAARKVLDGAADAPRWLDRALKLAPGWAMTHLWNAQWLFTHQQSDRAIAETAIAADIDAPRTMATVCGWLKQTQSAQIALKIAPKKGPQRAYVLDRSATCLPRGGAEEAKVDAVLLAEMPDHLAANARTLRRRLSAGDKSQVAYAAHDLQSTHPQEPEPYILEAQAQLRLNDAPSAVRTLSIGASRVNDPRLVLGDLAIAQAHAGDADAMRDTIDQLRDLSGGNPEAISQALVVLARAEVVLGNDARALKAAREAYDLFPEPNILALQAQTAQKLGQTDFALHAWEQACREVPSTQSYCRARDALAESLRKSAAQIH